MRVLLTFLLIVGAERSAPAKGAQVALTSDPPGATIYIGSAKMGITPLVLDLAARLPIKISSRFGSLAPVGQVVTPKDDEIVVCQFRHQYGTLIVTSDRTDALLTIDQVDFGHPPGLLLLSPGQHKLLLRAANAPDKTRRVEVQVGYRTVIKINFAGGSPETKMKPDGHENLPPTPGGTPRHKKRQPPVLVDGHRGPSTPPKRSPLRDL